MIEGDRPAPSPHYADRNDNRFFPTIDALRAVAALSVVIFHVIGYNHSTSFYHYLGLLLRQGWLGVDLFFVISGFVVPLSLFKLFDCEKTYFKEFLIKRAVRLAPLHYMTCAAFVILIAPQLLLRDDFPWHAALYATFLHNFDSRTASLINAPNWSLAIEVQFYLLILLIIPLLRRLNIWQVVVSGLIISIVWRSACYWVLKEDPGKIFVMHFYTTQLPGMIDCFAMGFAIARIMSDGELEKLRQWCSKNLWALCALTFLGYGAAHYVYTTIPPSWDDWRLWYSLPVLVGHHLLTSSTFATLVLVSCFLNNSLWLKITAPVRYLGMISYGIYLWHLVVILLLIKVPALSFDLRLALTIGITIALASASWHLLEKPLSRQFRANAVHSA